MERLFLRNSRRKFLISRRQFFQSSKKRSKSRVHPVAHSDAENKITMRASDHSNADSWATDKNLGNDSKNELQALRKRAGNKVVSDKEYDIKIYNERNKKKIGVSDEGKSKNSQSKIIKKLSGSSIIIVYENGVQNNCAKSEMELSESRESCKSIKVLSSYANHQKCSGDIKCSDINLTSSSSNKKFDEEINPSLPLVDNQNKIFIQYGSSKKGNNDERNHKDGKTKARMKLITPEELAEPKCLKIVKKAVNNDTDLVHDLSNMMTGGRLIKTLKSFLGDHNNKEAAQTSYVEIVQKLDDSDKKHKILIFKRRIEKCKKCKEKETLNDPSSIKPESNIIRLTVKKANENKSGKQTSNNVRTHEEIKNSSSTQSLENPSTFRKSSSFKSDDSKPLSLLQNSLSPDSNINVLLASTLNELAGLNVRNSLKSSYDSHENINDKSSSSSNSISSKNYERTTNTFSERSRSRQNRKAKSEIRSVEISENSFLQKSVDLADKRKTNNCSIHTEKNKISVICPPKNLKSNFENQDSFSHESETIQSRESRSKYEETVQSEEICNVSPVQSKIDCARVESSNHQPSEEFKILKRGMSNIESEKNSSTVSSSKNTSVTSDVNTENYIESVASNFEPVFDSTIPNHIKIPSLENDTTFMQFFESSALPKMGKNDFLADSSMKCMKTEYYILKKSYAAPAVFNQLSNVDSVQQLEGFMKEQSAISSQSDFKETEENVSITASEDSVISRSQIYEKFNQQKKSDKHSYANNNRDYLKLDFMNFDINKPFDSFITQGIEQNLSVSKQTKEKPTVSIDDKKKKKKGTLWHMKHNAYKMMKTHQPHCHKFI